MVSVVVLTVNETERILICGLQEFQRKLFRSLNISFRRGLVGNNLVSWYNLVARIAQVRLNEREDVFKWGLHQSGIFSVHSMYSALICDGHVRQNRTL